MGHWANTWVWGPGRAFQVAAVAAVAADGPLDGPLIDPHWTGTRRGRGMLLATTIHRCLTALTMYESILYYPMQGDSAEHIIRWHQGSVEAIVA